MSKNNDHRFVIDYIIAEAISQQKDDGATWLFEKYGKLMYSVIDDILKRNCLPVQSHCDTILYHTLYSVYAAIVKSFEAKKEIFYEEGYLKNYTAKACKFNAIKYVNKYKKSEQYTRLENLPELKVKGKKKLPIIKVDNINTVVKDIIKDEVSKLKKEYIEIIEAHFFQEMTFKEISKETGEKEGTLKSRYSRAIEKLREGLLKYEEFKGYV